MKTLTAAEAKINDFLEVDAPMISGLQSPSKLAGIVRQAFDQVWNNEKYKYVELITEKNGIRGAYLKMSQEIVSKVLTEEEQIRLVVKPRIKNLGRTVQQQGSDPEIFVVDKQGAVIPAFKFLKDKKDPNRIPGTNQPLFWDGFQAEFNLPVFSCLDQTVGSVRSSLMELKRLAQEYDKNAKLTIIPTLDVMPHMLREEKEEHVQFGCMPSKNAYGMKGKVADGRDVTFRSSGGHIHLELDSNQKKRVEQYVKALDAILGVACVSMFGQFDEPRRREYYGLAGEYRTPPHGLEYRPLSNVWMCHPTAMYIVFELARKVITLVDNDLFKYWKHDEQDVIACINDCNIPLANEILRMNEEMFKDILSSFCYNQSNNDSNKRQDLVDVVYNTFMFGIEKLISNVDDLDYNWGLDGKGPMGTGATSNGRILYLKERNDNYKKVLELKM
jgi:hypothetical protein